jgi:hypothetical protein
VVELHVVSKRRAPSSGSGTGPGFLQSSSGLVRFASKGQDNGCTFVPLGSVLGEKLDRA